MKNETFQSKLKTALNRRTKALAAFFKALKALKAKRED